jgi:hypothetical protein
VREAQERRNNSYREALARRLTGRANCRVKRRVMDPAIAASIAS